MNIVFLISAISFAVAAICFGIGAVAITPTADAKDFTRSDFRNESKAKTREICSYVSWIATIIYSFYAST